ncbi:hypothetical protein [Kribbella sp. NBC_00889]|uniref:hypothetical protein n=1 Tax=Kribbella sp. NBC_00889 TaxID=2975974 RepID=UPI00386DAA93|nr:hypothetical protein OG817_12700 [Kribbella sp. NBC_00889]
MTAAETPVIAGTIGSLLGRTAAAWRVPEFGLSAADRLVVTFSDGSAAFVKGARTEETAGWLRNEHRILDHLRGTSLAPEVLGWQDDGTAAPATSCTTSCSCSPRFIWRVVRRRGRCAPNPHPSSPGLQGRRCSAPA